MSDRRDHHAAIWVITIGGMRSEGIRAVYAHESGP
jgi:hypothetical protein